MAVDFTLYDDEALDALRVAVLTEQERRQIVATAQSQIAALEQKYAEAAAGLPTAPPLTLRAAGGPLD